MASDYTLVSSLQLIRDLAATKAHYILIQGTRFT